MGVGGWNAVLNLYPAAVGDDLRAILEMLDPLTRDALRRVLIRDHDDRDAVSSWLLRYRDGRGDDWADIIDMLTMHPGRTGSRTGRKFGADRTSRGEIRRS